MRESDDIDKKIGEKLGDYREMPSADIFARVEHTLIDKQIGEKLSGYSETPTGDLFAGIEQTIIDKQLGEKLGGYSEKPSPNMFAKIEKTLDEKGYGVLPEENSRKRRSVLFFAYRYGVAAAVMFGVFTLFLLQQNSPVMPADDLTAIFNAPIETQAAVAVVDIDNAKSVKEGEKTINSTGTVTAMLSNIMGGQPDGTKVNGMPVAGACNSDGGAMVASTRSAELDFMRRAYEEERQRQEELRNREVENYWRDMFLAIENDERSNRRGLKMSGGLFAGNYGAGNMKTNDINAIMASKMFVPIGSATMAPSADGDNNNYYAPIDLNNVSIQHKMPVNAGLSIAFRLSDNWSVVSGVNYSYLNTQLVRSNAPGLMKTVQEIHYIGVPVGVMYSFYNTRNMSLYARAGAAVETSVYATMFDYVTGASGTTKEGGRISVKGLQLSVDGAIGAQFRLFSDVGFYIEPGVSYYFEQSNQPYTYRTANPVHFSLRLGLRFGGNYRK